MIKQSEITGTQQVGFVDTTGILHKDTSKVGTITELRALRKDTTVALGRGLLISGIIAGSWSVEADEGVSDDVIDFITKTLLPLRSQLMKSAVGFGRVDYGFAPFEKLFAIKNGRIVVTELKQLLVDITTILVTPNGRFAGFRQNPQNGTPIDVPLEQSLLISFDVEAGYLYGYPLLENIRATQAMWKTCNDGAKRYDAKVAGAHWKVHYPIGITVIDGVATDNYDIAMTMLTALESSGSICMPSTVADNIQELNDKHISDLYQWDVSLIDTTGSSQASFIDRLKYLDSLKIRGLILPERSMLEGSYGTKAEAATHVGLAVSNMQMIDRYITQIINEQVVDQLLLLNWGEDMIGKARLVATPLVDLQAEFLRKLYLALLPSDSGTVDTTSLKEQLNIPIQLEKTDELNDTQTGNQEIGSDSE